MKKGKVSKKSLKIIVIVSLCLVCLTGAYLAGFFTNYSTDSEETSPVENDVMVSAGASASKVFKGTQPMLGGRMLTTGRSLHYQNTLSTCQQSEEKEDCHATMNNITFFVEQNFQKQDEVVVYASVFLEKPQNEDDSFDSEEEEAVPLNEELEQEAESEIQESAEEVFPEELPEEEQEHDEFEEEEEGDNDDTHIYFAFELDDAFNILYIEASEEIDANILLYLYSVAEQFTPKLQARLFEDDFNHRRLEDLSEEELELLSEKDFFGKAKPLRKIEFDDDDTLEASIIYDENDYIENFQDEDFEKPKVKTEERIKIDKKKGILLEDNKIQSISFGESSSRRNLNDDENSTDESAGDQTKDVAFSAFLQSNFTLISEDNYEKDEYEGMFDYFKNLEAVQMTKDVVSARMKAEQDPDYSLEEDSEEEYEEGEEDESFEGEVEAEGDENNNGRRNLLGYSYRKEITLVDFGVWGRRVRAYAGVSSAVEVGQPANYKVEGAAYVKGKVASYPTHTLVYGGFNAEQKCGICSDGETKYYYMINTSTMRMEYKGEYTGRKKEVNSCNDERSKFIYSRRQLGTLFSKKMTFLKGTCIIVVFLPICINGDITIKATLDNYSQISNLDSLEVGKQVRFYSSVYIGATVNLLLYKGHLGLTGTFADLRVTLYANLRNMLSTYNTIKSLVKNTVDEITAEVKDRLEKAKAECVEYLESIDEETQGFLDKMEQEVMDFQYRLEGDTDSDEVESGTLEMTDHLKALLDDYGQQIESNTTFVTFKNITKNITDTMGDSFKKTVDNVVNQTEEFLKEIEIQDFLQKMKAPFLETFDSVKEKALTTFDQIKDVLNRIDLYIIGKASFTPVEVRVGVYYQKLMITAGCKFKWCCRLRCWFYAYWGGRRTLWETTLWRSRTYTRQLFSLKLF